MRVPTQYTHSENEQKWAQFWEEKALYKWDKTTRENTFSIDTPPPTVSGSLHVGHVFSYTQTDVVARFQRMCGKHVFYPMGWDDNGLPTERRVQNVYGITCNPALPYSPNWIPQKRTQDGPFEEVARANFIEACEALTQEDEAVFEAMWRRLGLSIDWDIQYTTIQPNAQKISQESFLDLVKKGYVYQQESPTMWDVDFKTAVAQAEIEDRECPGAMHTLEFKIQGGGQFTIATTRPELLCACIAVVAHPDDPRYQDFFGKIAITPVFHAPVPIMASTHADPEKGTGVLMVCTFGDAADVEWWKTSGLPIKAVIGLDGKFKPTTFGVAPFESLNPESANAAFETLVGLRAKTVRKKMIDLLGPALLKDPEPIEHPVKFYEKGDSPIEFITTRQWFVSILPHKAVWAEQGEKIKWVPTHMKSRYMNWVNGLNQDWCISRQRFFGVPIPVWYPLDAQAKPNYNRPIMALPETLPIDPLSQAPQGYTEAQRHQPNGFCGDPDVMDTWATSSLTPQLASRWTEPMDIRPQSHEIIRTWAFYTIVKAWMHDTIIPWKIVLISGWVLDPDRKKMSKSKGNVVTPSHLLDTYSADAIRYWAARAKLGVDTAFDESVLTIGKKLVTKLFNASRFVMMQLEGVEPSRQLQMGEVTECLDKAWLDIMKTLIREATLLFESYEYATALEKIESKFWMFCDHYIELVKGRTYQEQGDKKRSASITLDWSLNTFLRLFAPFIPFVTEEIWSWRYTKIEVSVHKSRWPQGQELVDVTFPSWEGNDILESVIGILSSVRGAKTQAKLSMKTPVAHLRVTCSERILSLFDMYPEIIEDLKRAGVIAEIECHAGALDNPIETEVKLDTSPSKYVN